jgi:hypothetical protein
VVESLTSKFEHPANLYNKARHHVFSVYEKSNDLDKALEVITNYHLITPHKCGLKAELIVYDAYYQELKLDPLLDAGVKADFSGTRKGRPINIDVTTNLKYKDINNYVNAIQKKSKQYEIALVNLKTEDVGFFPLRFPICKKCGTFAHYILFFSRPSNEMTSFFSTSQAIIEHCPNCMEFKIKKEYSYQIPSVKVSLEEWADQFGNDPFERKSQRIVIDVDEYIRKEWIGTILSFEHESRKLLSAFAEGDYIVTNPRDGDGFFGGTVYWTHPLAEKYIDDTIDYDYYDGYYEISS